MGLPPKFAKRKRLKRFELGRKGQAHSGRLGGISKPVKNRTSSRSAN